MLYAESYDGLPPAGAECDEGRPDRLSEAVSDICLELAKIVQGHSAAYHVSHVLLRVQNETSDKQAAPISGLQRDRLLRGLALARPFILERFDGSRELGFAREGVDALRALIALWAEAPEARALRPINFRADVHARARWLRNVCHNICLREEIEERSAKGHRASMVRLVSEAA